jgi:hypothetical protein
MQFVRVPKGKAWLGGGGGRPGDREVAIPYDLYLGKYEVTQEEWQKVMGSNPSHFARTGAGADAVKTIPDEELKRFPVEMVSWDSAQLFLAELNKQVKEEGWVYRLPMENEWEYACRGGPMTDRAESAFDYYFDEPTTELRPEQANFRNHLGRPSPVGSYPPNPLGLYDMHGNVWEWVNDIKMEPARGGAMRKLRGGCWTDPPDNCRAMAHGAEPSSSPRNNRGLRLVRVRALTEDSPARDIEVWTREMAALPAAEMVQAVAARLKDLNPGFDGKVEHALGPDGTVTWLKVIVDRVTDISPVRALPRLAHLQLQGSGWEKGQLTDLSPLEGMRLTNLSVWGTKVADLSVLAGMKLTVFNGAGTLVTDLSPLRGMPLEYLDCQQLHGIKSLEPLKGMRLKHLNCSGTAVSDLSPVRGMPLEDLSFTFAPISDLSPLKGMPLKKMGFHSTLVSDLSPLTGAPLTWLFIAKTRVSDLSPLKGMKLTYLNCSQTQVTDLSVLREMPLTILECDFKPERDADILRSIQTLEQINGKPAAQFWKEVGGK